MAASPSKATAASHAASQDDPSRAAHWAYAQQDLPGGAVTAAVLVDRDGSERPVLSYAFPSYSPELSIVLRARSGITKPTCHAFGSQFIYSVPVPKPPVVEGIDRMAQPQASVLHLLASRWNRRYFTGLAQAIVGQITSKDSECAAQQRGPLLMRTMLELTTRGTVGALGAAPGAEPLFTASAAAAEAAAAERQAGADAVLSLFNRLGSHFATLWSAVVTQHTVLLMGLTPADAALASDAAAALLGLRGSRDVDARLRPAIFGPQLAAVASQDLQRAQILEGADQRAIRGCVGVVENPAVASQQAGKWDVVVDVAGGRLRVMAGGKALAPGKLQQGVMAAASAAVQGAEAGQAAVALVDALRTRTSALAARLAGLGRPAEERAVPVLTPGALAASGTPAEALPFLFAFGQGEYSLTARVTGDPEPAEEEAKAGEEEAVAGEGAAGASSPAAAAEVAAAEVAAAGVPAAEAAAAGVPAAEAAQPPSAPAVKQQE